MDFAISNRMARLKPSIIRELLKQTGDPGLISFAGGNPAPEMCIRYRAVLWRRGGRAVHLGGGGPSGAVPRQPEYQTEFVHRGAAVRRRRGGGPCVRAVCVIDQRGRLWLLTPDEVI